MMRSLLALSLLVGLCGGGLLLTVSTPAAPTIEKPEPWGTIKGRVVWADLKLPEPKEIAITRDKDWIKQNLKDGKLFSEEWVVNQDNRGMRWAFAWLAPPKPTDRDARVIPLPIHPDYKEIKTKEVVIDIPCCRFEPHALALREGQVLVIRNSAEIAHTAKLDGGPNGVTENVLVGAGKQHEYKNLMADWRPIRLSCSIHPWMNAWVRVFDHPYFAVTDADGRFVIKNAPAGEWRLFVWQEGAGWLNKGGKDGEPITIKAGQTKDLGDVDVKQP
jgi:hypothetical protein